jgi:TonB family protein
MKRVRLRPSKGLSGRESDYTGETSFKDLLAGSFQEKPLWTGLYESFRDTIFPAKLPPLELTSTPIPAPDPMAARTNPWAIGTATIANGGLLALLLLMGFSTTFRNPPKTPLSGNITLKDFTLFAPSGGGGGGGSNSPTEAIRGREPLHQEMPITPPQPPLIARPSLAVDPAIAAPLEVKVDETLPNIGVRNSPNVSLVSYGPGTDTGVGTGCCGGDGPGKGSGKGPGGDHGTGGGPIYQPGVAGVTNPVPVVSPEAEFSDEARQKKYQGVCMISIIVDAHGYPQNPRVMRSLGMGLDEKALDAVKRYRFKPALKDGKPVAAYITVEVDFRLY